MERLHRVDEELDRDHDDLEDDLEDDELGAIGRRALTDALRGPAEPLPHDLRVRLERATGRELDGVRIRTGDAAARAARVVGARAFAIGRDLVFGAGAFRPDAPDGVELLAHEVAHAVQQDLAAPRPAGPVARSRRGDAGELEAGRFAGAFARGARVPLTSARGAGALVQGEWLPGENLPTQEAEGSERVGGTEEAPVRMYRFEGSSSSARPVLLVGGMHGNERASIQVVDILLDRLQAMTEPPPQDIYVIPILHPVTAARRDRLYSQEEAGLPRRRQPTRQQQRQDEELRDPNRDYPDAGTARDGEDGRTRYEGTDILLKVVEEIQRRSGGQPPRIVQVHGTTHHNRAGISRDVQDVPPEVAERMRARNEGERADEWEQRATDGTTQDTADAQAMAQEMRDRGYGESVRGNRNDRVAWPGHTDHSLGEWGSAAVDDGATQRPAMSVITVETDGNQNSVDPRASRNPREARSNHEAQLAREAELMALADVIEQFLLGTRARPNRSQESQRGP